MSGATGKSVRIKSTVISQADGVASHQGAEDDGTVQIPDLAIQESRIMWVVLLLPY